MNAIGTGAGADGPQLLDLPRPEPGPDEALVRTLRVGVDGTDHEVIAGSHGGAPAGEDRLVLGHEAVGVVEDPNDTGFSPGDIVVPTVRREAPSGRNDYFERGEADMAPPEAVVERGIDGAHGFMSEYFTSPGEFLVPGGVRHDRRPGRGVRARLRAGGGRDQDRRGVRITVTGNTHTPAGASEGWRR